MAPHPDLTAPTGTTGDVASRVVARQVVATVTVVADNGNGNSDSANLTGGAIAGIVIGSIAGFLLLLWIIRSCLNLGAPPTEKTEAWYRYKEPPVHHHHRRRSHSRSSRRGRSRSHSHRHSVPPPVIIKERSRSSRRPPVYYEGYDDGTGRRYS